MVGPPLGCIYEGIDAHEGKPDKVFLTVRQLAVGTRLGRECVCVVGRNMRKGAPAWEQGGLSMGKRRPQPHLVDQGEAQL